MQVGKATRTEKETQAMTRKPARISKEKAHEMLGKSYAEGLRVRPARQEGVWLVSSCRYPNVYWRVTARGCPCEGFSRHGYCKHFIRAWYEHKTCHEKEAATDPVAA